MAEREQLEELCNIFVLLGSDDGNEGMIHELELSVGVLVPAPVYRLEIGKTKKNGLKDYSRNDLQ